MAGALLWREGVEDGSDSVEESVGGSLFGLGHEVKLIAPRYVKPFVKRQRTREKLQTFCPAV